MLELLQFIFSSFWVWLGTFVLVLAFFEGVAYLLSALWKK